MSISAIWHASNGNTAAVGSACGRDTLTPQPVLHGVATRVPLLPHDPKRHHSSLVAQTALVAAKTAIVKQLLLAIGTFQKLGNLLVALIELILAFSDVALQSSEPSGMFLRCTVPLITVLPVSVQLDFLQICDTLKLVKTLLKSVKFRLKIVLELVQLTLTASEILAQLCQSLLNSHVVVNHHFLDIGHHCRDSLKLGQSVFQNILQFLDTILLQIEPAFEFQWRFLELDDSVHHVCQLDFLLQRSRLLLRQHWLYLAQVKRRVQ